MPRIGPFLPAAHPRAGGIGAGLPGTAGAVRYPGAGADRPGGRDRGVAPAFGKWGQEPVLPDGKRLEYGGGLLWLPGRSGYPGHGAGQSDVLPNLSVWNLPGQCGKCPADRREVENPGGGPGEHPLRPLLHLHQRQKPQPGEGDQPGSGWEPGNRGQENHSHEFPGPRGHCGRGYLSAQPGKRQRSRGRGSGDGLGGKAAGPLFKRNLPVGVCGECGEG